MSLLYSVSALEVVGGRFDPRFYSPYFRSNQDRVKTRKYASLRDICEFSNETWDQKSLFEDKFPYIEIGSVNCDDGLIDSISYPFVCEAPSRAQMLVRNKDLVFSTTRPMRKAVAFVPNDVEKAIASTGFLVIRGVKRPDVLVRYLYHALRMEFSTRQFDQYSSGGNYPAITKDDFGRVVIPIPSLEVQRRIVAELDEAYAAKRAADQKAVDLLRSIDDMVLEELGIENVELKDGSLDDRIFITNAAQLAGMTLSPAHYYQQIDFGSSKYACLRIGEIAEIDPVISCAEQKTYQFIAMDGVSAERGEVENVEVRSGETNGYSVFGNGDVIFAKITPCMENGKSAVVENVNGVVYGSTEFMVLRMRDTRVLPGYLHLILRLRQFREVAACHFTGSAGHQRVDKKFVAQLPIPVPPASVQDRIVRKSKAMKAEAQKLKAEAAAKLESAKRRIEEELMEV